MADEGLAGEGEDKSKAAEFFARTLAPASRGNFDLAIDLYLVGLLFDPDNFELNAPCERFRSSEKPPAEKT